MLGIALEVGGGVGGAGRDTVRGWSTLLGAASIDSVARISFISLASSSTCFFFFTQGQDIRNSLLLLVVGHDVILERVHIFVTGQLDNNGGGNTRREQVLTCHTPQGMVGQFSFDTSISGHI